MNCYSIPLSSSRLVCFSLLLVHHRKTTMMIDDNRGRTWLENDWSQAELSPAATKASPGAKLGAAAALFYLKLPIILTKIPKNWFCPFSVWGFLAKISFLEFLSKWLVILGKKGHFCVKFMVFNSFLLVKENILFINSRIFPSQGVEKTYNME